MIVVTGSTGTIGQLVMQTLMARGEPVRAMTRDAEKARSLFGADAAITVADFNDDASVVRAFEGASAVFVLASPPATILDADRAALAAARLAGVKRIVKMSSLGANLPAATKLMSARAHGPGEAAIMASEISFTILRPAGFDSNALGWRAAIHARTPIEITTGVGKHPFIDPRDVAEVAALALTTDALANRALTLTGPRAMTAREQLDVLETVVGRPIESVDVSLASVADRLRARGLSEDAVEAAIAGQAYVRDGHSEAVHEDLARALGRPARSFETWVADHALQFSTASRDRNST
jgi:uncharacterized protein YbjT (DUF2867 family)